MMNQELRKHTPQERGLATRPNINITARTFDFAVRLLRLVRALPRDVGATIVARQIARCGTSVGANVEEAQAAQSRADFVRKMNIARSEAKEVLYWLRLIAAAGLLSAVRLRQTTAEADEIIRVLTAIVSTARGTRKRRGGESVLNS